MHKIFILFSVLKEKKIQFPIVKMAANYAKIYGVGSLDIFNEFCMFKVSEIFTILLRIISINLKAVKKKKQQFLLKHFKQIQFTIEIV